MKDVTIIGISLGGYLAPRAAAFDKITQDMQTAAKVSESTLYPVLRRLQKNGALVTFDRAYMGRNRRYYRITELGETMLSQYRIDWENHKQQVDSVLLENAAGKEIAQ